MFIHAIVATIRTGPEPAVFPIFNCINEVLADLVGCSFGITVLVHYNLS